MQRGGMESHLKRPKGESNNNPTASASPPPWIELPVDVTANILRRLSPLEILFSAQIVCSTWRSVCADPSLWRVIHMGRHINTLISNSLCRRAVDRSQGELIDICIRDFGNDDLLLYISERSKKLKILSLEFCPNLSPGGLTTAVKNLSGLEELHLFFFTPEISYLDIETIGVSCPGLNSFTFNDLFLEFELNDIDDSLAMSIAKNMPNLLRLRLVGNRLSNEGLLAILDDCPNLELLDILHCFYLDLECDLGIRCSQQVKELRRPLDSTADCEWDDHVYDPEVFGDML